MASQSQNPDGALALKPYYRDNINKAGDRTQGTVQSKHSGNMNPPSLFPLPHQLACIRTHHLLNPTSKANISENRDTGAFT